MAAMQEFDLIRRLARQLQAVRGDTRLGMGDDCAVLAPPPDHELVVTTDTLVAGRHFPEDTPPADIGFKALAVSLSDVAAMGAAPAWATIALTVPSLDRAWCKAFVDGLVQAIGQSNVDIIGGDTTRGPLSITGTVFGTVPSGQAIRRCGARPGDRVCVTGTLGDAALGLRLWPQAGDPQTADADADSNWLRRRLSRPQWRPGTALPGRAHAAIDLSDGLLADLGHILQASGCGAVIDTSRLPASAPFEALCPATDRPGLQLTGGDDYELCIVLPPSAYASLASAMTCPLTPVGEIRSHDGIALVDADGRELPLPDSPGWDHFR